MNDQAQRVVTKGFQMLGLIQSTFLRKEYIKNKKSLYSLFLNFTQVNTTRKINLSNWSFSSLNTYHINNSQY